VRSMCGCSRKVRRAKWSERKEAKRHEERESRGGEAEPEGRRKEVQHRVQKVSSKEEKKEV